MASLALSVAACGCGTTKARLATEQLVMSDAVDQAVQRIDFRALSGRKVFLDDTYTKKHKSTSFVNSDYIVSSIRQQMVAADCRLQDSAEDAELVAELRIGTLGSDNNEVVYGLPASNVVSSAAELVPSAPVIPPIPEISLARKEAQLGAVKLAVFVYDRETRRPVWQSGMSKARSQAQDLWVFGAGPFQSGSVYDRTQFAGTELKLPKLGDETDWDNALPVPYDDEYVFAGPEDINEPGALQTVGHVAEIPSEPESEVDASPPPKPAPAPAEASPAPKPPAPEAQSAPPAKAPEPADAAPPAEATATEPSAPAETPPPTSPEAPASSRRQPPEGTVEQAHVSDQSG
jgi:hypothetical protein